MTAPYSVAQTDAAAQDTIWTYGYPLLQKPLIVINQDGALIWFQGGGIHYTHYESDNGERGFSESTYLSLNDTLWKPDWERIRAAFGWTLRDAQEAIIRTIAYNTLAEKKNSSRSAMAPKENKFMAEYENWLKTNNLFLNAAGRLYKKRR